MTAIINAAAMSSTLNVKFSDGTVTLDENDTLTVNNGNGIFQDSDYNTDDFQIHGQIHVTNASGMLLEGMGNTVTAAFSSIITGNIGIFLTNSSADPNLVGNTLTIAGRIEGSGAGIYNVDHGTTIFNSGSITGGRAVVGTIFGIALTNNALASIDGDTTGIDISAVQDASQQSRINNNGSISGHTAILGGGGQEIVVNHGTITGDVDLGSGNDIFDGRGGEITGSVDGGAGSDTYFVDSADANILETTDNDPGDTVEATVSFKLGANFEELILLGSAKNGTGNTGDNNLHGNSADNSLKGEAGEDFLYGGRGDDILTGGADADLFDFEHGFGNDTIKDFHASGPGHDVIGLTDVRSIANFSDLMRHHVEQDHGNVIIHADHNDTITLEHIEKSDLHRQDFTFDLL